MTAMPDKGISSITYNFLNLPKQLNQNSNITKYYYRADGTKLKKQFTLVNSTGTKIINTEYLDGFQYSTPNTEPLRKALEEQDEATVRIASAGELEAFSPSERLIDTGGPGGPIADNMVLSFFPTAEGFYDYEKSHYIYQYLDHLGNVRLSFTRSLDDGSVNVLSSNNYYPFGLNFISIGSKSNQQRYNPSVSFENFKFGAKELEETGMYDQDARFYMPDLGRFSTHDPLSEITSDPYGFAYNNPIFYNDPTGMEGEAASSDTGGSGGETGAGGGGPGGGGSYDPRGKGPNDAWHNKGYDAFFPRSANSGGGNGSGSGGYNASVKSGGGGGGSKNKNKSGPKKGSSQSPDFPGYRPPLPSPGLIMMDSVWDIFGIVLANSEPKNKYATYFVGAAAIVISKGRAADDVLKAETRVFRAVDDVELASINKTGKFLVKNGGTEAKYFANSLENAHKFGKQLYPNGYTVVEGRIYNSNNPMKYWSPGTDNFKGAFIFHAKTLKAVKPIKTH